MQDFRIAIIEDNLEYSEVFKNHLTKYATDNNLSFHIKTYMRGESFLDIFSGNVDIIFLDIEFGEGWMNGIEIATSIRKNDALVPIIFVTNMPQYAPEGYEVNASDYILKPVNYNSLSVKLSKIIHTLNNREGIPIRIKVSDGARIISSSDLYYIEVMGHDLIFHTKDEEIHSYGGLTEKEHELKDKNFARVSASVLVNLRYVNGLYKDEISIGNTRIKIGRSKKKDFIATLNKYLGG